MTVHFIGAGPGAADLLTVRAVNLLRTSPVCLYAGTYLDPEVLAHCVPDTELIDTQHLDIDQIVDHLARANASGKDVARLCSGDPSAYAAAAALLGTELTVPELVQSVVLTRTQARSTAMPDSESLVNFAQTGATLVLHLAITRIRTLATELIPGYGSDCPVAVVYRASQPEQQVVRGTLTDIADQVEAAGLRQAAIILVGRALTDSLSCAQSHLYDPARDRHVST
jgi:precorrin-4/cobalt-precorrin-4 C11-methyltransferase